MATTPLFPIAISSQLDDTGVERIHAAPILERVFPVHVPDNKVPAILLNGSGESEHFMIFQGTISVGNPPPETPDFCNQITKLSTGRLLARHSLASFTKDGTDAWVDTGNDLDDNPSVLEVDNVLITGDIGGYFRSLDFGDSWTPGAMGGNPIDFVACGSTVFALCSSSSNKVFKSTTLGSSWTEVDLTGLNWNGPSVSGTNKFAAAVGDTAVLAGKNVSLNVPAVLVTLDAGATWDVVELPVTTGYTQITGVNTDGTDILIVLSKPTGDTDGIIYKFNSDKTFTTVLATTNDFAANIWHAKGVWYVPTYTFTGQATWWWSANGVDWEYATYGSGYNELLAVCCDARGTGE